MTDREHMKALGEAAQASLAKLQALVTIPDFWAEFEYALIAVLRSANALASACERYAEEHPKACQALEQHKKILADTQAKITERDGQIKQMVGMLQADNEAKQKEITALHAQIKQFRAHPAVIAAELESIRREASVAEKRALELKVRAAEIEVSLQQAAQQDAPKE
jgi:chromosome segregation ATPase